MKTKAEYEHELDVLMVNVATLIGALVVAILAIGTWIVEFVFPATRAYAIIGWGVVVWLLLMAIILTRRDVRKLAASFLIAQAKGELDG